MFLAVKVQRPGIADSIAIDMLLLRRLMAAVDRNIPQVGFRVRVFRSFRYKPAV